MPFRAAESSLPLTPVAFEILMALADKDQHGYGILLTVEGRLGRVLPIRTGTLYRALARLVEDGLIEEAPAPQTTAGAVDERRKTYHLTTRGRRTLRAEAARLADQVEAARARRLLPGSRR